MSFLLSLNHIRNIWLYNQIVWFEVVLLLKALKLIFACMSAVLLSRFYWCCVDHFINMYANIFLTAVCPLTVPAGVMQCTGATTGSDRGNTYCTYSSNLKSTDQKACIYVSCTAQGIHPVINL